MRIKSYLLQLNDRTKTKEETNERKYTILLLTENICNKCSSSGKMPIDPLCFILFILFLFYFYFFFVHFLSPSQLEL